MKRLSLIMMSVALVLGMAQCKKNVEPVATTTSGTMNITLDVDGGSKVSVTPSTGVVRFQTGDKIYVASHGKYVGTLTHNGSNFTGNISGATADEPLYFYFMGNKTPTGTLTAGTTASIAVSIYDQTSEFPVISAAPSNENFSESTYTYTATLLNKCALVKFNVTTPSSAPIIITGVNDVVTVTFSSSGVGTFVSSQSKGAIKMAKDGNNEYWAILAGDQGNVAANGVAYSADLMYNGTCGAISGISNNGYLDSGITVTVSTEMPKFSVAAGTQVRFAPGNLQYQSSTQTWRFAENQYDCVGITTANATPTAGQEGWMDLFCWGRWTGADSDAVTSASTIGSFTDFQHSRYSISNGYGKNWRTLTNTEQCYLLDSRTGCSTINGVENARYSKATVAGKFGLMIFPDSFTWPSGVSLPTANAINQAGNYTAGSYNAAAWTKLHASGAVFWPCAGLREDGAVKGYTGFGGYWSKDIIGTSAYFVRFGSGSSDVVTPQYYYYQKNGLSVRLVN